MGAKKKKPPPGPAPRPEAGVISDLEQFGERLLAENEALKDKLLAAYEELLRLHGIIE